MTDAQRNKFYFPACRRCFQTNGWQMVDGRLIADLDGQRAQFTEECLIPAGPVALEVLDAAKAMAAQDHCAITAEHLRHACNHVATNGRTTSTKNMTNAETNRVVDLFHLLEVPHNKAYIAAWFHPEEAERRSYLAFLRKQAHEAVLIRISENAFQTRHYAGLDIGKLRWIAKQVKDGRPNSRPQLANRPY
jgi:hypothetical protein